MQFSFKHNIKIYKLLQDPKISARIHGLLLSYTPYYHGRIDNNMQDLKKFLLGYLHDKEISSLNLNEAGSVKLVEDSRGSVSIVVRIDWGFFFMNEKETLELIQGIVLKSLVNIEESQQQLQNYFKAEDLHSKIPLSAYEKEYRIDVLTKELEEMRNAYTELKTGMRGKIMEYEENYRTIFNEFERVQEENQNLLKNIHEKELENRENKRRRDVLYRGLKSQNKCPMKNMHGDGENQNQNHNHALNIFNFGENGPDNGRAFQPGLLLSDIMCCDDHEGQMRRNPCADY